MKHTDLGEGLLAGLVATAVMSVLMLVNARVGVVTQPDTIQILAELSGTYIGLGPSPAAGWMLHILIGTILWGTLFALLANRLPFRGFWAKGLVFGVLAWLLMMLVVMALGGAGWFAMAIGIGAAVTQLVLHLAYGLVLGLVYAWLPHRDVEGAQTPA